MKNCIFCMNSVEETAAICPVCGKDCRSYQPLLHQLKPGTILNGKFEIGTVLGEGGFGITYIGKDLNLDIRVAVKEYYPMGYVNRSSTVSDEVQCGTVGKEDDIFTDGRKRFLREARILAKFSDEPGIVHVRDFFEENNTAYIVMEYLDGEDLKSYLRKQGRISYQEVIALLTPVMEALRKIHAEGLIHRDISPDNIRLCGKNAKLIDFGAARNVSAKANKSLSVMLKPGYAPEEQYRSKGNQGAWTDVYALCATMYKCITGITPDDATQRVFHDELKKPSELGIDISPQAEAAIWKGLALTQKDRWQNIGQLLGALTGNPVEEEQSNDDDKPTEYIGSQPDDDDKPTEYIGSQPDDDDKPTEYIGSQPDDDKPTEYIGSQPDDDDKPTEYIGSQPDDDDKPTEYIRPVTEKSPMPEKLPEIAAVTPQPVQKVPETAPAVPPVSGEIEKTTPKKRKGSILKKIIIAAVAAVLLISAGGIINYVRTSKSYLGTSRQVTINNVTYSNTSYITVENETVDSVFLQKLGKLEKLSGICFNNCTVDASEMNANVGQLTRLLFTDCQVSGWNGISGMNALKSLRIASSGLDDAGLSAMHLEQMTALQALDLSGNAVTDFSAVASLTQLTVLALNDCSLTSLDFVSGLTSLEELYLSKNQLSSLHGLENLIYLKNLMIDKNTVSSLNPIQNCAVLQIFSANDTRIQDISILSKSIDTLKYCSLDNLPGTISISPLTGASSLEVLSMKNMNHGAISLNGETSLTDTLKSLTGLKYLCIDGNTSTLFPDGTEPLLQNLEASVIPQLEFLSAEGCHLPSDTGSKVVPELKQIQYLFLSDCHLTGTAILPVFDDFHGIIDLSNNQITELVSSSAQEYGMNTLAINGNSVSEIGNDICCYNLFYSHNDALDFSQLEHSRRIQKFYTVNITADKRVKEETMLSSASSLAEQNFISEKEAASLLHQLHQESKTEYLEAFLYHSAEYGNEMTRGYFTYSYSE